MIVLAPLLGVDAALASVAKVKHIDIVQGAREGRIADVQFVLQHAPEKVNDQDSVFFVAAYPCASC